jgi:hypothetical protein
MWFSANWAAGGSTNRNISVGLQQDALTDTAELKYNTGNTPAYYFRTRANATETQVTVPATFAASTFSTVDIIVVADTFAACWIDGDGPYVSRTNVPRAAASGFEPAFFNQSLLAGTNRNLYVDWCHLETVGGIADPSLIIPGGT